MKAAYGRAKYSLDLGETHRQAVFSLTAHGTRLSPRAGDAVSQEPSSRSGHFPQGQQKNKTKEEAYFLNRAGK